MMNVEGSWDETDPFGGCQPEEAKNRFCVMFGSTASVLYASYWPKPIWSRISSLIWIPSYIGLLNKSWYFGPGACCDMTLDIQIPLDPKRSLWNLRKVYSFDMSSL